MTLSVVILNYKVPYFLQLCLQSVQRSLLNINSEIIVVDNASGDESLSMLKEHFPEVVVIANSTNLGFSKANNLGVKKAKGDYICILNPDTVLPENCFEDLLNFAEKKEKLGAVGVRLIDGTGIYLPESKRNLTTLKVSLKKITGDSSVYYANQLAQDEVGEVPVLVGAFMFIRKKVYEELCGFDEDFFMYGEDIDLSYRLIKKGYKNYYFGKITALHFKGESSIRDKTYAKRFYGAMRIFNKKHFSKGRVTDTIINIFLRILTYTFADTQFKTKEAVVNSAVYLIKDLEKGLDNDFLYLEKPLKIIDLNLVKTKRIENCLVVFDFKSLQTEAIIGIMQMLKNNQNRFRIRPSNCNFIAGSDSSADRGEIRTW